VYAEGHVAIVWGTFYGVISIQIAVSICPSARVHFLLNKYSSAQGQAYILRSFFGAIMLLSRHLRGGFANVAHLCE
jgi:hypothetical protein